MKSKHPEDLGVKIGTKDEVFWTGLKDKCEDTIRQCTFEIEIQRHLLELAEKRIAVEKEKLK